MSMFHSVNINNDINRIHKRDMTITYKNYENGFEFDVKLLKDSSS